MFHNNPFVSLYHSLLINFLFGLQRNNPKENIDSFLSLMKDVLLIESIILISPKKRDVIMHQRSGFVSEESLSRCSFANAKRDFKSRGFRKGILRELNARKHAQYSCDSISGYFHSSGLSYNILIILILAFSFNDGHVCF